LDDQQSGDYPVDDDDFNSGSGSGKVTVTGSKTVYFMTIGVLRHIQSQETILCIKPLTPNVPFWHITPTLFVNDNL